MNKKRISFIYRLLVIASLLGGIILNLYHTISIVSILSYFTLQINIMCLVVFIVFEIADIAKRNYREHEIYYVVKGALTISVLIMIVVYQISLAPNNFQMDSLQRSIQNGKLANLLVHEVSPILVIVDYILFDDKAKFKFYYPIIWLFVPLNYVFYVYAYSAGGGNFYNIGGSREFAYFFLDYKQIGYEAVIRWIIIITIVILLMGYLLILIDKLLAKLKKKFKKKE